MSRKNLLEPRRSRFGSPALNQSHPGTKIALGNMRNLGECRRIPKSEIRTHSNFKLGRKADSRNSPGQKALEWPESGNALAHCIPYWLDLLVAPLMFDHAFKTIIYKSKQILKRVEAAKQHLSWSRKVE